MKDKDIESKEIATKLYFSWVQERQEREGFRVPDTRENYKKLGLNNFKVQHAKPRRNHLKVLSKVAKDLTTADTVALLVMLELPALEITTLLQKMRNQLNQEENALYFSKTNQFNNCGCGCGSCCAYMEDMPWDQQINSHLDAKPYSIDPFNEVGIPQKERDALLIKDFLKSYKELSGSIVKKINEKILI